MSHPPIHRADPNLLYKHDRHAGNRADVHKHALLSQLALHWRIDTNPFFFLDTHAGAGRYRLARDNANYALVCRLLAEVSAPQLTPFLQAIRDSGEDDQHADDALAYPGSSLLVQKICGSGARMCLIERAPTVWQRLRQLYAGNPSVEVRNEDVYRSMVTDRLAAVSRALVLIDPPYVEEGDAEAAAHLMRACINAGEHVLVALWYPLDERGIAQRLSDLLQGAATRIDRAELRWADAGEPGLHGSGMLIANPAQDLGSQIEVLQQALLKLLARTPGASVSYREG